MSVGDVHTLYACNIAPTTVADAIFIDQVANQSIDPGIQEILSSGDGQVDPTHVATMQQAPRISFSTSKLATLLAEATSAFLLNGLKIDSDVTYDGAEFWFQKIAEGGTRTAGANHIKMTVNEGLLLPRAITAAQGGIASIGLDTIITYDGTNNPIVIATGQALEGAPSISELFTLGPVSLNGTTINGVQSVSIDPGLVEIVQFGDGQVWPTFVGIMQRQPLITLTTLDVAAFNTFGLSGTAQSATDSVVYLRKIAEGGTRVADDTAEHIKFSIDDGKIIPRAIAGANGAPQMMQLELRPTWDGTNAIIVIDTASAIA